MYLAILPYGLMRALNSFMARTSSSEVPIAFAIGGTAIIFGILLWGPFSTYMISAKATGFMRTIILIAVPLCIFMACVLERAGIAEDLYTAMLRWMGGLRGSPVRLILY